MIFSPNVWETLSFEYFFVIISLIELQKWSWKEKINWVTNFHTQTNNTGYNS
jgi:hypothetical protein